MFHLNNAGSRRAKTLAERDETRNRCVSMAMVLECPACGETLQIQWSSLVDADYLCSKCEMYFSHGEMPGQQQHTGDALFRLGI